jgi:hypothetical protein
MTGDERSGYLLTGNQNRQPIGFAIDTYGRRVDICRDLPTGALILNLGLTDLMFTREIWRGLAAFADEALRTREHARDVPKTCTCEWDWNSAARKYMRTQVDDRCPWHAATTCAGCHHRLALHDQADGCAGKVYPSWSLDGEPCPCDNPGATPEGETPGQEED